ncbi:hypothetical protein [Sphingobacterium kitahiroshimense]|uniref:Uncharacterized protein n=1 Tax=Sphingobacterium kitahiroshimense TaxID=470446 RepID=A0ABV0BZS6_9SPHI
MSLKEPILKILIKQYAPLTMVEQKFGRYDLMFKTDDEGRPIMLFLGKKDSNGNIIGDRYARRLKIDDRGNTVKDHWEHKGKAT